MHPRATGAARHAVSYCCASKQSLTGDRSWNKTICKLYGISRNTLDSWKRKFPVEPAELPDFSQTGISEKQRAWVYKYLLEQNAKAYKNYGTGDWN